MTDEPVSRGEFDLLREIVRTNTATVGSVTGLATQMGEVIKDVSDLKREVEHRFDAHEKQHEKEELKRVSARRWAMATVVAVIAAVDGPLVTILLSRR